MGPNFEFPDFDHLVKDTEGLEALVREVASQAAAQLAACVDPGLAGCSAVG